MANDYATFLLVHGGFHGGWCWCRLAERLQYYGHTVYTPTLTGLGERAHLLSPNVGLETHINDIMEVIKAEELRDFILVGHSVGGVPVTAVADRMGDRIRQVVFFDAILIENGQSYADISDNFGHRSVTTRQDGVQLADTYPASVFGLTDKDDISWVDRRLTPHPYRAFSERLYTDNKIGNGLPCAYVAFTNPVFPLLKSTSMHAYARNQMQHWTWLERPVCHDAMVSNPDIATDALLTVAALPN